MEEMAFTQYAKKHREDGIELTARGLKHICKYCSIVGVLACISSVSTIYT